MVYHLRNIYFSPEPDTNHIKLMKIRNGFLVSQEEAEVILDKINSKEPFITDINDDACPMTYGIRYDSTSQERIDELAKEKKEAEVRSAHIAIVLEKGIKWLDTLSEEDREMVEVLGFYHFQAYAVS